MIPIGPGEIPTSGAELSMRVVNVLSRIITSGKQLSVSADMTSPDAIDNFILNVTGAECGAARMDRPTGFTRLGEVKIAHLQITGDPALVFGAPVTIKTRVANVPMSWSRDDKGMLWLVPAESASATEPPSGDVEIAAAVTQIEQAARATVAAIAEQNGAKLKDLKLRIEAAGPRAIAARVDVAASKFMMTAKVGIIAEASLDDQMNLNVGRLEAKGDGAAGGMVANMLADKLRSFQGKQIALGQFAFAGAALQDIQLKVDDQIRLTARFGNA